MRRFYGDTDQSDIVLCDKCASRRQGPWVEEPGGTCEVCLFNERPAICLICHQQTHHYQPYREVPKFALEKTRPWKVNWNEFRGLITVNICRECRELGFAPVYASEKWVELANASEWIRPELDFSKPPIIDIEELHCRRLTGF
jgi:hypothetical protein